MAALRSFCPKTVVQVGSYSPKGAAPIVRSQFSSFPNHTVSPQFGFLKIAHNNGIRPIHAVQSNVSTQVDLEDAVIQEKEQEQEFTKKEQEQQKNAEETKMIHVRFQLTRSCMFGENFFLVGDDPMMGSWDPSKALPMTWSEGHIWTVEQNIPAGTRIQFKYILRKKDGEIVWQPGSDRILHTWESMNRVTFCVDWENDKLNNLIENAEEEPKEPEEQEGEEEDEEEEVVAEGSLANNEEEFSEGSQTNNEMMMKPIDEQNMKQITAKNISSLMKDPVTLVAENIGSSKGNVKPTKSSTTPANNDAQMKGPSSGKAAPTKNQERKLVKKNNQSVTC